LGEVKHIDPAFSPDGRSLYFISDREGFSDVYRLELASGEVRQVTRLATGVSGITGLSPALTVASESGRVLLNVFDGGGYAIHALSSQQSEGNVVSRPEAEALAAVLPPREVVEPARVVRYLEDPTTGLHSGEGWTRNDYDPDLQLDYISQPSVGIAADRFGASIGGGIAAFFSDMLGNRELGVATNINGRLQDIAAQAQFTNRKNRWNWGLQGGRIPYTTLGIRRGTVVEGGDTLLARDLVRSTTALYTVGSRADYPFSGTVRVEGNASYTRWTFSQEADRTLFDPSTGLPVDRRNVDLPSPDGFNVYNASTALVQDDSYFGFTSPVRGSRARLEVGGNLGALEFMNVLGDVRRYFFWNPVTLALRGYHFGRYGGDSEDPRLTPLYLGFETFVRGYGIDSFRGSECSVDPENPEACPEFDRLLGSRMALGNVELRVPLIGTERFGLLPLGFVPTELSLFADAGVAWTADESPELTFEEQTTERVPVFSTGAALRFNLLGRLVVQVYGAHPFQRPNEDWVWGFTVAPGF
ncbi:MAG TPA: BamA/TamA family outer membrane protein, partial [Longimicrobiales bacterium]|nr:BamA/TamA family outer membrane protein [Longimicrobiales bacterium]